MNRKGIAVIAIVGIVVGVIVGGGFVADIVLRNTLGVGLFDIFNIIASSGATLQDAPSLEDVMDQIDADTYTDLKEQKDAMIASFQAASENLDQLNNNTDLTGILDAAFGADYKIYMFSVTTVGNLTFKVFEWSIQLNNGLITSFTEGESFESSNVYVQIDQSIATVLLSGEVVPDQVLEWVKNDLMKINPITEVTRFVNALPNVIQILQSSAQ